MPFIEKLTFLVSYLSEGFLKSYSNDVASKSSHYWYKQNFAPIQGSHA